MEKNNINIIEILKDCPKGMKLYSPLFGDVKLEKRGSDNISIFLFFPRMMKDMTFLILLRKMDFFIPDIRKQNVKYSHLRKCPTGVNSSSEGTW